MFEPTKFSYINPYGTRNAFNSQLMDLDCKGKKTEESQILFFSMQRAARFKRRNFVFSLTSKLILDADLVRRPAIQPLSPVWAGRRSTTEASTHIIVEANKIKKTKSIKYLFMKIRPTLKFQYPTLRLFVELVLCYGLWDKLISSQWAIKNPKSSLILRRLKLWASTVLLGDSIIGLIKMPKTHLVKVV